MIYYTGLIAEYGTREFEDNKAVYTILAKGIYTNPHGIEKNCELYHRSEGYHMAGSCAVYGFEVWGYRIYQNDGTTTGKMFDNMQESITEWNKLVKKQ